MWVHARVAIQVNNIERDEHHRGASPSRRTGTLARRPKRARKAAKSGLPSPAKQRSSPSRRIADRSLGESGHLGELIYTRAAGAGAHRDRAAIESHLHPRAVLLHLERPPLAARHRASAGKHRLDTAGDLFLFGGRRPSKATGVDVACSCSRSGFTAAQSYLRGGISPSWAGLPRVQPGKRMTPPESFGGALRVAWGQHDARLHIRNQTRISAGTSPSIASAPTGLSNPTIGLDCTPAGSLGQWARRTSWSADTWLAGYERLPTLEPRAPVLRRRPCRRRAPLCLSGIKGTAPPPTPMVRTVRGVLLSAWNA
jgi:hypothetical protein